MAKNEKLDLLEIPKSSRKILPNPEKANDKNVVDICGERIEIKPVKIKYCRDRTAYFYGMLEATPLPHLLAVDYGLPDGRDMSAGLLDWLIAATDNAEVIEKNFNEIDAETVYKILEIFKRINKIDDIEEKTQKKRAMMEEKV